MEIDLEIVLCELQLQLHDVEYIGSGKSAMVFKIKNEEKVLKVFYNNKIHELLKEKEAYNFLNGTKGYLNLHDVGNNYLLIDYFRGKNLYDYLLEGLEIKRCYIEEANFYVNEARKKGLNPNDVHLKNIMINDNEEVVIVDLARFLDKKLDKRWEHIYKIYNSFYHKKWNHKKVSSIILKINIFVYKFVEKIL
jgi:hypothetical protein